MKIEFYKALTKKEVEAVHTASLEVLEHTGSRILNDELLKQLGSAGVKIDWEHKVAKFPGQIVEDLIKKAPNTIKLYARDGESPIEIGKGITHAVNGFDGTFTLDYNTGKRKPITKKEVGDFAWIADQLSDISIVGVQGLPQDVQQQKAEAHAVSMLLQNTCKHIIIAPDTGVIADAVYQMIKIAIGSDDIGSKPVVSCHISPSAPQEWTPSASEIVMNTVANGVPFYILPAPMAGATSPVTLAGHLVQHNAQVLSGIAISQILKEGFPVVYCNAHTLFNMREGNPIIATPETMLLRLAGAQMARFYGIPSHSIGFDTDAHIVDQQCSWEKALSAMACISAGIDVIVNLGMFSTGLTVSYESLVLDHEVFSMLRRFQRGIEVTDDHLAVDVINKIGTWGSFLEEEHTIKHFKNENWYPEISCRTLYERWIKDGSKDVYMEAHEKAQKILSEPRAQYIDPGTVEKLEEIIA
ncbi:MAG: trimethylamine methyltransferase family protein [Spirochaetota bacterium]|nr:MAG: trimethylamine methyltransferase family protein [Spirochaetota bacterium]